MYIYISVYTHIYISTQNFCRYMYFYIHTYTHTYINIYTEIYSSKLKSHEFLVQLFLVDTFL